MKKLQLLGLVSTVCLFAGCSNGNGNQTIDEGQEETQAVNTDVKNNESGVTLTEAEVESFYFEDAVNKADLIAQIEILDVLEEVDDPSPKTIFRANLVENVKGTSEKTEIFILQQGNSTHVFNDNLLFEQGDNYILFLAETTGLDIENSYYILGEETGMYKLTDQSTVVKIALRDEALDSIEIPLEEIDTPEGEFVSLTDQINGINMNETGREIQILQQDELESMIRDLSEEGQ